MTDSLLGISNVISTRFHDVNFTYDENKVSMMCGLASNLMNGQLFIAIGRCIQVKDSSNFMSEVRMTKFEARQ